MTKYQRFFTNDYQISTNSYVRIYQLFMQNKPKVKDAQINVNSIITMRYEKMNIWLFGKNKANQTQFKPNQSQFKPILRPIKAKTNPIEANFTYPERGKNRSPIHQMSRFI